MMDVETMNGVSIMERHTAWSSQKFQHTVAHYDM